MPGFMIVKKKEKYNILISVHLDLMIKFNESNLRLTFRKPEKNSFLKKPRSHNLSYDLMNRHIIYWDLIGAVL